MTAEEQQHYNWLAATRLSEIGYRRYLKFMRNACKTRPANEVRGMLKEYIDKWEAREYRIAHMINCAPMYAPIM